MTLGNIGSSLLPNRLLRIWRPFRHWYVNYLSWPVPLWRLRGTVPATIGGYSFSFCVTGETPSWARTVSMQRWEVETIAWLKTNLRSGDRFLDVGAWVGPYTLLASRLVDSTGEVFAFEPDPIARAALDRNISANNVENVTVVPQAVSDQRRMVELVPHVLGDSRTKIKDSAKGNEGSQILAVSLDEFCEQRSLSPSVIKIDVEGGETRVFSGGTNTLRRARAVILEFHELEICQSGEDPQLFWRRLFGLGKGVFLLDTHYGLPSGAELSPDVMIPGNFHLLLI